jgi:type 1 glutamine amidotransferase
MLHANIETIEPAQATALLDYVASGKGFIPIHCATYCFRNDSRMVALMGAQFRQHGPGNVTTQPATNLKPFECVDVGPEIPNYPASKQCGVQEKPLTLMQQPVPSVIPVEQKI